VLRLRELGFEVHSWWYNPNIEPAEEHARREASLRAYADQVELPVTGSTYDPDRFEAAVRGQEERPARCRACYRLRLEATARAAQAHGIETFTTTLLISPYQDQAALRQICEEVATRYGLRFFFENLRRGWGERSRLARQHGLYLQTYCGCRFSLAERDRARERRRLMASEGQP